MGVMGVLGRLFIGCGCCLMLAALKGWQIGWMLESFP